VSSLPENIHKMCCLEGQEIFFKRVEEKESWNRGRWKTVVHGEVMGREGIV